jgi:hypothetical protein
MAQLKPLVVWRRSGAWAFTALANLNTPMGMSLVWLLYQAATAVSGKAPLGRTAVATLWDMVVGH